MTQPFFSIVIPTRDRPHLLDKVLWSLARQTFRDFEVIVSDNYVNAPCKEVCNKYQDAINIRYVKPDKELNAPDHYEFAWEFAKGIYISTPTDKTLFYSFSLEKAYQFLREKVIDSLTYLNDSFNETSPNKFNATTTYHLHGCKKINAVASIEKYATFWPHLAGPPTHGLRVTTPIYGFIKKTIFQKVKSEIGSVFLAPNFDVNSTIFFAHQTCTNYYLGFPLVNEFDSLQYSNGRQTVNPENVKKSLEKYDPHHTLDKFFIFKDNPYVQPHLTAASILQAYSLIKKNIHINQKNLLLRMYELIKKFRGKNLRGYYIHKFLYKLSYKLMPYYNLDLCMSAVFLELNKWVLIKKYERIRLYRKNITTYQEDSVEKVLEKCERNYNNILDLYL